ncbi:MAG: MBL fold metallo-hydrolase [Oligoflexales bacterium]|nr:MBL fold metallo-hydrolase [Oligoflexales bacterium]
MLKYQLHTFYPLRHVRKHLINYCYVLIDENSKHAICIDPAWEPASFARVFEHHHIKTVDVFLTHHHYDHVDLAQHFAETYDSSVYMHEEEISFYQFSCKNLRAIKDETPLQMGSFLVHPIFTPGHTVGSLCYLVEGRLFTGDTLFNEGCGLCSGPGGDPSAMFDSLNRLKRLLQAGACVYPGHRYQSELGQPLSYLMQVNLYLHITDRQQFIDFRMRKGQKASFAFQ